MKALKFLAPGACGRFSQHAWPMPDGTSPGAWVAVAPPIAPCARGIHACRGQDLAYWLDDELWSIELAGTLIEAPTMLIAERGRLIARVTRWDAALRAAFGAFCVQRARETAQRAADEGGANAKLAAGLARDTRGLLSIGQLSTAAYVSAFAAQHAASVPPEQAFAAERSVQSAWLAERLFG